MKEKAESGKLKAENGFEISLTPIRPCFSILVPVEPLTLLLAGSCVAHLPDVPVHVNFFVQYPAEGGHTGPPLQEAREWLTANRAAIEAEARKKLLMMGSKN